MTLDEKIKVCEDILLDFRGTDAEADDYSEMRDDIDINEEFFNVRIKIIKAILNKLDYTGCGIELGYDNDDYEMESLIFMYLENSKVWTFDKYNSYTLGFFNDCFGELTEAEYLKFREVMKGDFGEELRNTIYSEIDNLFPFFTKNEHFLEMFAAALDDYVDSDEEWYELNVLGNSHMAELIENNAVNTSCLDFLKAPMMLFPYNYDSRCNDDYSIAVWFSGYCSSFREVTLEFAYLNSRFLIGLLYVDLCYEKYQHETDNKEVKVGDFEYN